MHFQDGMDDKDWKDKKTDSLRKSHVLFENCLARLLAVGFHTVLRDKDRHEKGTESFSPRHIQDTLDGLAEKEAVPFSM